MPKRRVRRRHRSRRKVGHHSVRRSNPSLNQSRSLEVSSQSFCHHHPSDTSNATTVGLGQKGPITSSFVTYNEQPTRLPESSMISPMAIEPQQDQEVEISEGSQHWQSSTSIQKRDEALHHSFHTTIQETPPKWNKRPRLYETKKKPLTDRVKQEHWGRKMRRRGPLASKCTPCCCLASAILSALSILGLAALITALVLASKTTKTSTSTTSTTSTTTTSTTTTTATTTTSTTTSSTSSSTSSSSTTSSTSSTSSSTSTTTTSVTTATTSTTSTTSATTTTVTPPCPPTSVGGLMTLWTTNSPTTSSYACQAYSWTASTTGNVSLQFQLQHDPGRWYLDDVSVFHGGTQLLINGGFESGVLSPWFRTAPNGNGCGGQQGAVSNSPGGPRTGSWFLWDGYMSCYDQVEQKFSVIASETYVISFWLRSTTTSGSPIFARVLIS